MEWLLSCNGFATIGTVSVDCGVVADATTTTGSTNPGYLARVRGFSLPISFNWIGLHDKRQLRPRCRRRRRSHGSNPAKRA